jgi:hypothetical protein
MSRYIEVVYDNSGSMRDTIGKSRKYEIAQILFEKEILPTIGQRDDKVVLRLLRDNCNGKSIAEILPNNKAKMLERIKQIEHDQSTPLFHTIADAVESCRLEPPVDEYLIFVLTDGDDTCHVKINDIIDQSIIDKFIKIHNVNMLLTQLAIESDISSNNLTAFTNHIGGRTVSLRVNDDLKTMRSKMKVALNVSGFSTKRPLEYCYNKISGFDLTWDEVEERGIYFYDANLMFELKLIQWKPDLTVSVTPIQLEELKFIHGLKFKTDLPVEYVNSMLAELKQPYYYSHNCIYWDFSVSKWKYFKQQNSIRQVHNPGAVFEDNTQHEIETNKLEDHYVQKFNDINLYTVKCENTLLPSYTILPYRLDTPNHIVTLREGTVLKFRN